jgi:hypothetical protein
MLLNKTVCREAQQIFYGENTFDFLGEFNESDSIEQSTTMLMTPTAPPIVASLSFMIVQADLTLSAKYLCATPALLRGSKAATMLHVQSLFHP